MADIVIDPLAMPVGADTALVKKTLQTIQLIHDELGLTLVVAHVEAEAQSARVEMGPVLLKGTDGQVLFVADKIRAELEEARRFAKRRSSCWPNISASARTPRRKPPRSSSTPSAKPACW